MGILINSLKRLITALSVIIVIAFVSGCTTEATQETFDSYQVNAPSQLVVRTLPSKSGEKITSLSDKTVVKVDRFEDGWAHLVSEEYDGYVNGDYLIKIESQSVLPASTYLADTVQNRSSDGDLRKLGYKILPYFILGIFLIYTFGIVSKDDIDRWIEGGVLLALSLSEIGYMCCKETYENNWFLEPRSVGWIMTIIDYILLLGLACVQGLGVIQWSIRYASGCFNAILTWIFSILTGLIFFALIYGRFNMHNLKGDIIFGLLAILFIVAIYIAITYYSVRDWSLTWQVGISNMIFIPSYLATVVFFAWPLLICVVLLLFYCGRGVGSGGNPETIITIEDEKGIKTDIRLNRFTPYRGQDVHSGRWYERDSSDHWREV